MLVFGLTYTLSTSAANLYRYKDENGVTALSLSIPPHLVKNGYEILGSNGRVIEVVPPALTVEQIQERDKKAAEAVLLAEEQKRQQEADAALLKLYSHPNDAVRVLKRKLLDIKDYISLKNGNISVIKSQLEQEETKAANMERTGRKVPDSTLNKIAQQKEKIIEIQNRAWNQVLKLNACSKHPALTSRSSISPAGLDLQSLRLFRPLTKALVANRDSVSCLKLSL